MRICLHYLLAMSLLFSPVLVQAENMGRPSFLSPPSKVKNEKFQRVLNAVGQIVQKLQLITDSDQGPKRTEIKKLERELKSNAGLPGLRILYDSRIKRFYCYEEGVRTGASEIFLFTPKTLGKPILDGVIGNSFDESASREIEPIGGFFVAALPFTESIKARILQYETLWTRSKPGSLHLTRSVVPQRNAENAEILAEGTIGTHAGYGKAVVVNLARMEKDAMDEIGKPLSEMTNEEKSRYLERTTRMLKDALETVREGNVLVIRKISPEMISAIKKVAAIITEEGDNTSHAAAIARDLDVPVVLGCGNAARKIKNSDIVTVDANRGKVYKGRVTVTREEESTNVRKLPRTHTKIGLMATNSDKALKTASLRGAACFSGISLLGSEFVLADLGVHPRALEAYDYFIQAKKNGITNYAGKEFKDLVRDEHIRKAVTEIRDNRRLREEIAKSIRGYPSGKECYIQKISAAIASVAATTGPAQELTYRISDLKTNEFGKLTGGYLFEKTEANPAMGERGVSRMLEPKNAQTFQWELEAVKRARDMGYANISMMLPMARTPDNLRSALKFLKQNGLERGKDGLKIGMAMEIPAHVFQIDDFLKEGIDFVSVAIDELGQFMFACEAGNKKLKKTYAGIPPSILRSLQYVSSQCRSQGVKIEAYGQTIASNPELAEAIAPYLDSIGVTSDSFVATVKAVAKAKRRKPRQIALIPEEVGSPQTVSIYEVSGNRIFLHAIKTHPMKFSKRKKRLYERRLYELITGKAEFADKNDMVVYSTTDLTVNAFATLIDAETSEIPEENPLMGFRGLARHLYNKDFEEIFRLELRGIKKARGDGLNVGILLKTARTLQELDRAIEIIKEEGLEDAPLGLDISVSNNLMVLDEVFKRPLSFVTINKFDLAQNLLAFGVERSADTSRLDEQTFINTEAALIKPLRIASRACAENKIRLGYLYGDTLRVASKMLLGWEKLIDSRTTQISKRIIALRSSKKKTANLELQNLRGEYEQLRGFMDLVIMKRERIPLKDLIPTQKAVFSGEMELRKDEMRIGIMPPILVLRFGRRAQKAFIMDGHTRSYLAFKEGADEIPAVILEFPKTFGNLPKFLQDISQFPNAAKLLGYKHVSDMQLIEGPSELSTREGYELHGKEEALEEKPEEAIVLNENGIPTLVADQHPDAYAINASAFGLPRLMEKNPDAKLTLYTMIPGNPEIMPFDSAQFLIGGGYTLLRDGSNYVAYSKSLLFGATRSAKPADTDGKADREKLVGLAA